MSSFNIGDRVWTAKRGFGIIRGEMYFSIKRPYSVAFDADQDKSGFVIVRYPKRKNIESEEYGKMMVKLAEKIDAKAVKVLHEEIVRPKFKVGDIVYYESKTTGKPGKYEVTSVYPDLTLRLIPTLGSEQNPPFCVIVDPNLVRHWIPTKITHQDTMDKCQKEYTIKDLPGLYYVGKHLWGLDAFFQDAGNGKIVIWYGIKGDDIS